MYSPQHMYDDNTLVTSIKQQQRQQNHINSYSDLSDLNTPELSMDLQNLIGDSRFNAGLFTETLAGPKPPTVRPSFPPCTLLAYTPQPVHFESDSNATGAAAGIGVVKEEPLKRDDYRSQTAYSMFNKNGGGSTFTAPPPALLTNQLHHHSSSRKSNKSVDKNTDEYKQRRERNNIAVRKSREKAKVRGRETDDKLKLLMMENEVLRKKIEVLSEERNTLKSLFSNVGMLPEHLHRELNRHLDTYQQQDGGVQSMW